MRLGDVGFILRGEVDAEVYEELGQPQMWLEKGQDLRAAAEALWRTFLSQVEEAGHALAARTLGDEHEAPRRIRNLKAPAIMLMGMAVENLLKAILVARSPETLRDGALPNGRVWRGHDLAGLAREAGVVVSSEEETLYEMATAAIGEWGRYPIAARRQRTTVQMVHTEEVFEAFGDLCDRLIAVLDGVTTA